jgi:hypothetical protein
MLVLVLLDREHLDNGPFLKSLAGIIAQLRDVRILFIHSDSEYTDRIMQLGLQRKVAVLRSTRELNRRLVALFNDEGIPCVGLNGFQMNSIHRTSEQLTVNADYLHSILIHTHLILSNLISEGNKNENSPAEPVVIAKELIKSLKPEHFIVFSMNETAKLFSADNSIAGRPDQSGIMEVKKELIPNEMEDSDLEFLLTNLKQFARLPDTDGMVKVNFEGM